ncbi:hypothetical protein HF313_14530 [Massilia atriviolacea]|uniref:Uncharacterized protein n=2 Tax=Massilia atriviolacea TaxID=2495579 RepID=A0A430HRI2_9BURK|nr:hypothetical protein EJB06_07065 [Massilia atriviolacea]
MFPILTQALAYVSRVCGFDTVDSFPPGHVHARTHWSGAHFDIASDLKPDQIERALCEKIANTPLIFSQIANPTPDMQRVILGMIGTRLRHSAAQPLDLVSLLVNAYRSPYTREVLPGLRAAIEENNGDLRSVLDFLGESGSAFGVIDAAPHQSGLKLVGR